ADSRHATLCDADSRGFIVVAFCSAILHHWMCKIPTEVATLTVLRHESYRAGLYQCRQFCDMELEDRTPQAREGTVANSAETSL
uniref:hypothetical protein n=1 Tax=Piscirickettsia salmonis TaxID=1238 RepID=UPI002E75BDD4